MRKSIYFLVIGLVLIATYLFIEFYYTQDVFDKQKHVMENYDYKKIEYNNEWNRIYSEKCLCTADYDVEETDPPSYTCYWEELCVDINKPVKNDQEKISYELTEYKNEDFGFSFDYLSGMDINHIQNPEEEILEFKQLKTSSSLDRNQETGIIITFHKWTYDQTFDDFLDEEKNKYNMAGRVISEPKETEKFWEKAWKMVYETRWEYTTYYFNKLDNSFFAYSYYHTDREDTDFTNILDQMEESFEFLDNN